MRIGQGFDAHRLVEGRALVLGGVTIPHERGLEGHSDADVLFHCVADAVLGALGAGDLGRHFPSSDETLRGIASREILARVVELLKERNMSIVNLDATVIAQAPRLSPYQAEMTKNLAAGLDVGVERINLKLTSTDHLGALGREEGIAALAVVLVE